MQALLKFSHFVQQGQARPGLNDEEWGQSGTFGAHADFLGRTVDFQLHRLGDRHDG
jgi:hypothetical protein